jgi:ribosome-binding protein aMBF1 (putative translation factor)
MKDGLLDRDSSFASDLTRLRTQQEMSEPELADTISCTPQCIRAYESNKRRPQQSTVHAFNDVFNGRNSSGMKVVDTQEGARPFFDLKDIPNDLLAAEVQRRLLAGVSE